MHLHGRCLMKRRRKLFAGSSWNFAEFAVEARDEQGVPVADGAVNEIYKQTKARGESESAEGPIASAFFAIPPGRQLTSSIHATGYLDLARPESYSLQLWRKLPYDAVGEKSAPTQSC